MKCEYEHLAPSAFWLHAYRDLYTPEELREIKACADAAAVALDGNELSKRCGTCRRVKPLSTFHHSRTSSDDRSRYCRECEAKRVKRYHHAH
jgi:hypothetical protein